MRILVTNDDGYRAEGIRTLVEAVRPLGEVRVVAPDREQSATSHSLTLNNPLRVSPRGEGVLAVDGTPTDCVILALGMLVDARPDVVLSGINHGPNLGDDVLYSGTVAAAMEATILGVPGVAISLASHDDQQDVGAWGPMVSRLLEKLLRTRIPADTLLNVNLPPIDPGAVQGVRLTTLGRREYVNSLTRAQDPAGKEFFWIGGGESRWWGGPDSDFRAIHEGCISVTPLHLDLTNYKLLEDMSRWDLTL